MFSLLPTGWFVYAVHSLEKKNKKVCKRTATIMSLSSTSFCKHDILWRSFFLFSSLSMSHPLCLEKRRKSSLLFCACFHLNSLPHACYTHSFLQPSFPVIFRIISHPSLSLLSQGMRATLWSPSTSWWMSCMDFYEERVLLCIFFLLHQLLVSRWEKKSYPQSEQQEEGWEKSKKIKADINEVTRAEKMMMKRHTIE